MMIIDLLVNMCLYTHFCYSQEEKEEEDKIFTLFEYVKMPFSH